jgi:RND family efflux transporter MFP subunit
MAPIYARATGYVKGWNVDIGAHVKAGQVLATLDTPDVDQQWMQAKAELASAVAADKLAAVTAVRWHQMVNAVSRQDVDTKDSDAVAKHAAVDSAQANVARLEALEAFKSLVAPFDGIVTQRNTDVGNLVNAGAGQPMFEVADMHEARIYVRVPQAFLGELKPGIKAILDIPQYPDERFEAKLVSTSNSVTEDSRSALVQLQADNPDDKLWPGSFTEVHFQLAGNPDAIRLPSTALIFADHGMQVAILDADGTAKLKTVQIGRDLGESVEITSGVSASDRVIDNPPETLGSGDPVRMVGADAESAPAKVSSTAPVGKDKVE